MTEPTLNQWINVNNYMEDEYRALVVEIALHQREHAPADLRNLVSEALSDIDVPGFRNFQKVPFKIALSHVERKFSHNRRVADAIIALWSESQSGIISELREHAVKEGLHFRTPWTWKEAAAGYHDFVDIPQFDSLASELVVDREKPDSDHFKLAELWLSGALCEKEKTETTSEEEASSPVDDAALTNEKAFFVEKPAEHGNNEEQPIVPGKAEEQPDVKILAETETVKGQSLEPDPQDVVESPKLTITDQTETLVAGTHYVPESPDVEWDNYNIDGLLKITNQALDDITEMQEKMREVLSSMIAYIDDSDCSGIELNLENLEYAITDWKTRYRYLEALGNYSFYRLEEELSQRPDFITNVMGEEIKLEKMAGVFEEILQYDERKRKLIADIEHLRQEINLVEQVLLEWDGSLSAYDRESLSLSGETEPADMTVEQLLEKKTELHKKLTLLTQSNQEKRDSAISLIRRYSAKLLELKKLPSDVVLEEMTLGQIESADFDLLSVKKIHKLEKTLQVELSKYLPGDVSEIASKLRERWNQNDFEELLKRLSANERDVELVLTLMTTALANKTTEAITLPSSIYARIRKGVRELAGFENGNRLMGWFFPVLLTGYTREAGDLSNDLCFIALELHAQGFLDAEDGLLWEIAPEWPTQGMPGWSKLWQSSLFGKMCSIYSDDLQKVHNDNLDQAEKNANSLLTKDNRGRFYKLSSLASTRHMIMMERILQEIDKKLTDLKAFNAKLKSTQLEKLQMVFEGISTRIKTDLKEELDESSLSEMYEHGIREDGIRDISPYLERTSKRILSECANGVLKYGDAIIDYWSLTLLRISGVDSDSLRTELAMIPNLSEEGKNAVNSILQAHIPDEADKQSIGDGEAINQIINGILNNQALVRFLPRVIGYLTETNEFSWEDVSDLFEQDLAIPMEPQEISYYLLEEHPAPNHVLSIVQDIPLEQQNLAQALKSDFEHQYDDLSYEILQLGGKTDDLKKAKDSGRWGWLLIELKKRSELLHDNVESERLEEELKIRNYRKTIQDLDDQIFDLKHEIPVDVYNALQQGFASARRMIEKPQLFGALNEFCTEIDYRILHRSWSHASIREAVDQLEKRGAGVLNDQSSTLTAEKFLDYLEQNDLSLLGIENANIYSSQIDTRIQILKNWIKIKHIRFVKGWDLTPTEIAATKTFFSYFARLMSMSRYVTDFNKSLDSLNPILHEFWEMTYPGTNALDNQYIFMTLPGNPPTNSILQFVENFIEEKEHLEYYYVLLFVPGGNANTLQRLERKGLVVIDELRLIEMLLAALINDDKPLGKLRPLVLNAINANADIFITNQSVNARTSIFVGRDSLIDRIVNGGDNYAIYGGRRIGKSSVMKAVEQRLDKRGYRVISMSIEGEVDCSDDQITYRIAQMLDFNLDINSFRSLKETIIRLMDQDSEIKLAICLDEIDRYILSNPERHILIESLRACSDKYGNRFRVIIAGFMSLYYCLHGKGPYSTSSDPWMRMFTDIRELENLTPINAEAIVREGFNAILGWKFENRAIPQRIVERTGGHPAFVQAFCFKLLELVRIRKDQMVLLSDVEKVFTDQNPQTSFIAYVQNTFKLNLDAVSNYLILWLALEASETRGFTMDNIKKIADQSNVKIPTEYLLRSLDLLKVTSVIREKMPDYFEFTVPDYPKILNKLGTTSHMDDVENKLKAEFNSRL